MCQANAIIIRLIFVPAEARRGQIFIVDPDLLLAIDVVVQPIMPRSRTRGRRYFRLGLTCRERVLAEGR